MATAEGIVNPFMEMMNAHVERHRVALTTPAPPMGDGIILLDQFTGPNDRATGMPWDEFVARVQAGRYDGFGGSGKARSVAVEAFDHAHMPWSTTAYQRDVDGRVRIVAAKWDSSG